MLEDRSAPSSCAGCCGCAGPSCKLRSLPTPGGWRVEARLWIIEAEGALPADDVQVKRIPAVRVAELTVTAERLEPAFITPSSSWSALDDFLRTDPRDVGCAQAMKMLHIYAELTAAGAPAEQRYPGIAAHLRACGPCGEDLRGCWPPCATRRTDRSSGAGGAYVARSQSFSFSAPS